MNTRKTAILFVISMIIGGLLTAQSIAKNRQNIRATTEKIEALELKTQKLQDFELQVRQFLQYQAQKIQSLELKALQLQFHTGYSSIPETPPDSKTPNGVVTTE